MIRDIRIESLKSIHRLEMECGKLNLLAGTNSSGKSTTLQGLLLIAQNLEENYGLNGPLVSIGNYREARNYNISSDKIGIIVKDDAGESLELVFCEEGAVILNGNLDGALAEIFNFRKGCFHYLSCNRIGSQDIYQRNLTLYEDIGINGEYAVEYLCRHRDNPLEEEAVYYKENYTLSAQVNYWLKYIVGATIKTEEITGTDVVKASYGVVDGIYSRSKNVGSGISYLVSILIVCLGSRRGDIILIENPEIHLHPLSQSRVCEFLYFISEAGRQIFIETHSDHIFNAARAGIATGKMVKENISIHFFKLGSDNCTRNYAIEIGEFGKIENPVPGLFDQFQQDYDKMLGLC
ncbi:MAG: AAA family ATPase [Lachnospiraceae bacterium]|nr:AAA family ATPase [Lachnospiraceae bacterium]